LIIRSTEPESGKTLLLAFMDQLVCDPLRTSNTSDAVIYYQLDEFPQTTFLIDETEFFQMSETFIEMFDAGHRQGGYIHRTVAVKGGGRKVVPFGVFGPIALAGVEGRYYPPQMLTRSISFYMQKEAEGRDELWPDDPHLTTARNYIIAWAASFQRPQHCEIPALGRAENNYQPLIEIGESLGYGATARAMARALYRPFDDPVVQVLADIRRIFDGPPRIDTIWSPELLEALHALEDASWDEFRGVKGDQAPHKLRKAELYDLLRPKGLRSRTVSKMVGGKRKSHKGFYRTDLEPVWHRLFGAGAPAQGNKIISLPRRSERRSGDADE
jgi:hypothetical protein